MGNITCGAIVIVTIASVFTTAVTVTVTVAVTEIVDVTVLNVTIIGAATVTGPRPRDLELPALASLASWARQGG